VIKDNANSGNWSNSKPILERSAKHARHASSLQSADQPRDPHRERLDEPERRS
jgi:hypothetical protein